jgi:hypothetical protein
MLRIVPLESFPNNSLIEIDVFGEEFNFFSFTAQPPNVGDDVKIWLDRPNIISGYANEPCFKLEQKVGGFWFSNNGAVSLSIPLVQRSKIYIIKNTLGVNPCLTISRR